MNPVVFENIAGDFELVVLDLKEKIQQIIKEKANKKGKEDE